MTTTDEASAVLVVDDDALLRWHATDALAAHGYQVLEAENAETALRILEDYPRVKVLFTDVQMPGGLDGLELAQKVHERWPEILLLVTSGNVKPTDRDIPDEGRFLAKPYSGQEIVDQVADLIATGHEEARSALTL